MTEQKSLITELPKIIERGKKEAERILDGLSKKNKITLQTNELVLPTKAKGGLFNFTGQGVKGASIFTVAGIFIIILIKFGVKF